MTHAIGGRDYAEVSQYCEPKLTGYTNQLDLARAAAVRLG